MALGDFVGAVCPVFFDNILVFGESESEYVDNMLSVLRRLPSKGFKASVKKTVLFATEVLFCGQLYSADGVRANPSFVESVVNMARPTTAADLQAYLASTNWLRGGVPRYAELVAPLQELLKLAVRQATSAKRQAVLKVRLEDVEGGWTMEHERAFAAVNSQLAKSVILAYPRADCIIRVFTDASQIFIAEKIK